MKLNNSQIKEIFLKTASVLKENESELTKIDSSIGDGDHGVAILKVSRIIENHCNTTGSISEFFTAIGNEIMNFVGGSTSTLWGSYMNGLGEGAAGCDFIDVNVLKKMLQSAFENVNALSGAKEGDKTMMDALIPASKAASETDGDIQDILKNAAAAAAIGAERSADYIAKFGRAKNLKERVIGYKDAGAVSISLLFAGMANAVEKYV